MDYSVAIFDGDGELIANAPHLPVHLGNLPYYYCHYHLYDYDFFDTTITIAAMLLFFSLSTLPHYYYHHCYYCCPGYDNATSSPFVCFRYELICASSG